MGGSAGSFRCSDLAASAVWSMLGAALVIHGCSSAPRREPAARPAPAPSAPAAIPAPAPAPAPAPEPAPAPRRATFTERPPVPSTEPDVRVRVAALRGPAPAVRLSHSSGSLRMQGAGLPPRPVACPVEAKPTAAGWRVTEAVGSKQSRAWDVSLRGTLEFAAPPGSPEIIAFDGRDWPGDVRLVPVTDAPLAVDVVVAVPLERYLPGVLAQELYETFAPETYRAQAIAARSFTVSEHAHWARVRHYDLVAGEASQAWIGETRNPKARQAAAATRGMLLVHDGRVVPAYYSSTCGGTPASAIESLTNNPNHGIPPLMAGSVAGRACTGCAAAPKRSWTDSFTNAEACERLRRWAGDQLRARQARDAAANPMLPPEADPSLPEPAPGAPLEAMVGLRRIESIRVSGSNAAGRPVMLTVIGPAGAALELRAEDFRRALNYAPAGSPVPKHRLPSSHIRAARVVGERIEFEGSGYGHGVGMCQFGAEGHAKAGRSAEEILATYYPGATVVRAY